MLARLVVVVVIFFIRIIILLIRVVVVVVLYDRTVVHFFCFVLKSRQFVFQKRKGRPGYREYDNVNEYIQQQGKELFGGTCCFGMNIWEVRVG